MPFESPVMESEAESGEEKETRFSRSEALAVKNSVVEQIRAYSEHVRNLGAKTGTALEQIVAEEKAAVSKAGITEFLRNLKE